MPWREAAEDHGGDAYLLRLLPVFCRGRGSGERRQATREEEQGRGRGKGYWARGRRVGPGEVCLMGCYLLLGCCGCSSLSFSLFYLFSFVLNVSKFNQPFYIKTCCN